ATEGRHAQGNRGGVRPGQDADADGNAECGAGHERPEPSPVQRAAQLPDRIALHEQPECDDQRRRLQRGEDVEPDRRDDEAEGEAGEAGDQRAGKGREKKQRQFECRSIHVPAPHKSEQRLNGIAISRGGCDFPGGRLCPAEPWRQDATSYPFAQILLLTLAAIGWANSHPRADSAPAAPRSIHPRSTRAVASSIGKKLSMRSSCSVISCGMPSVAMVVNSRRSVVPLRKCIGNTGAIPGSASGAWTAAWTPSYASNRFRRAAVSADPSAAASASTLRMK